MKKIIAILVVLVLALGFVACENEEVSDLTIEKAEIEDGKEFSFEGVTIVIPDDYIEDELQGIKLFYVDKYPQKTDNINFVSVSGKASLSDCSKDNLEASYEASIGSVGGTFEITDYKTFKIDGKDSVKCVTESEMFGMKMTQTQYIVILDSNYVTITFTDASGEYTKEFEDIASTISVK